MTSVQQCPNCPPGYDCERGIYATDPTAVPPRPVRTDELARNAALNALTDQAEMFVGRNEPVTSAGNVADWILGHHTVTWERELNESDVPVRRYVLRSAWEVDPEGLAFTPMPADVRPEYVAECAAVATLVELGKLTITHAAGCICEGTHRLTAACVTATTATLPSAAETSEQSAAIVHANLRAMGSGGLTLSETNLA